MADTLGSYLRGLREQARLTLRDVEAGSGISNAYLSQLERDGVKEPSPRVLWAIAECYQADYLDLLRRAGHPVPSTGPAVAFAGAERLTPDERQEIKEIIALKPRRRAAAPGADRARARSVPRRG